MAALLNDRQRLKIQLDRRRERMEELRVSCQKLRETQERRHRAPWEDPPEDPPPAEAIPRKPDGGSK